MRLPWELRFGGIAEYATGRPFNITTGVDNNGDGANTDRPVIDGHVVGRNGEEKRRSPAPREQRHDNRAVIRRAEDPGTEEHAFRC